MEIFPAIDLLDGNVVRLTRGDFNKSEVFSDEPADILDRFGRQGATNLHLVDLNGARNRSDVNFGIIEAIVKRRDFFVEIGGGIRDMQRLERYIALGVGRVILGTAAVKDEEFLKCALKEFGSQIAVGVDAYNAKVAVDGWKTITEVSSFDFCEKCRDIGVSTVIYTDISTDGVMCGTNMDAFSRLSKVEGLNVIASGGVTYESEVAELKRIGVYGVILGKALYKGKLNLQRAIKIAGGEI